ncbi:MAG TPA: DUF6152 family protein [Gammaproteobacteria bacterium]|nr:DUF6152 family protein [Gammaproteobacteria bacterium]
MIRTRFSAGVAALACIGFVQAALAHHSVAAEFDTSKQGELQGVISHVWFANPHVRYQLTVTKPDGTTENWELQGGNVTNLQRQDWTASTIVVGDAVKAFGDFGRDHTRKLRIIRLTTSSGRVLPPPDRPRRNLNAVNAEATKQYGYGSVRTHYAIDITGPWRNDYKWHVTVNDLDPKPTPFTAEGEKLFAATKPWQDYSLRCVAPGLPRIFGAPYNMSIIDAGPYYLMLFVEHNTPRRVWMDGRAASADTPATPMGFSVGHWEGDVLVVETTHLSPGWLDGSGLPMSGTGTRIVERYAPSKDGLTMDRTMTIYDPYYTQPLVRHRASARDDNVNLTEQAPCDPDSYYRDLESSGRLDAHFNR